MSRIAILQCEKLPSFVTWDIPNREELFEEDRLLIRGFEAQGWKASAVPWTDPTVDWSQFDVALIRSTWDYLDAPRDFLNVLSEIESSSCSLYNPLAAVRWNMNKQYLFDLHSWGIPSIPTVSVSSSDIDTTHQLFAENRWRTVILKPTMGLGGAHSYRIALDELGDTITELRVSQPHLQYLVQPYIPNIVSEGEWSFVYFNGQLSHVLLKQPAPDDYRVQGIYGGRIRQAEPAAGDLLQAQMVMDKLPFDVLYARLDFVRVDDQLAVMEVEFIEPIFSFNLVPESIARLVHATQTRYKPAKAS